MLEAIAWPKPFETGCNAGHPEACLVLAKVYSNGYDVEPSRIETRKWFEQACNHGSVEGCESVGHMMLKGDGGKPDPKAALVPLQKACDGEDKEACLSVGAIYAEGMGGVKTDRPKALGMFETLCDSGHRIACENVDAMIGNDWGLPPGEARFETLLRLCDKRSGVSCHRLGLATASGSGIKKDAVRAKELFTRGCDLGFNESCKRL
jgi:TPR repeat protein